ncbi:fumarase C-terminus-domain-containing protein [Pavlovales sp. CCMP2436]|nr:fumarase C-terminus-domain-containing protein [Pavlovales sp. CCMP2436]
MTKGGGSANKTFLFQKTKAVLNPTGMMTFLEEAIKGIGTSACPPYHLAIVVGGLSAELTLKTVKLASARYYDTLPTTGDETGRAFRDLELEAQVLELTREMGIGAQFGGKYFCHDIRVIRLPRHGASCPVGVGVSCSADRQAKAKITRDGVFVEALCKDVSPYLPEVTDEHVLAAVGGRQQAIREELALHPIRTRLSLTGTLVVARDIAHAKLLERLERGEPLPQYAKDHIIYYAGPAKTPEGYASGSFGPTTAGRMDAYVDRFMAAGGSFVTLAKGNRSKEVARACKKHGGFYLGSIGGPAAILAQENITKVTVLDNEEDGMEAVWKIEVKDFPAFIVCDDKGNDFFSKWMKLLGFIASESDAKRGSAPPPSLPQNTGLSIQRPRPEQTGGCQTV